MEFLDEERGCNTSDSVWNYPVDCVVNEASEERTYTIPDTEGRTGALKTYVENAIDSARNEGVEFHNITLIFKGDISGAKGGDGLTDLLYIQELHNKYPEIKIKMIAGNRDDNRIRFATELTNTRRLDNLFSASYGNGRNPVDWNNNSPSPIEYWKEFLSKELTRISNLSVDHKAKACKDWPLLEECINNSQKLLLDDELIKNYKQLSIDKKRVIACKWMLDRSMAADDEFENRRLKLKEIGRQWHQHDYTSEEVAQSFIEEVIDHKLRQSLNDQNRLLPRGTQVLQDRYLGLSLWYMRSSQIALMHNGIPFTHSAIQKKYINDSCQIDEFIAEQNAYRLSALQRTIKSQILEGINSDYITCDEFISISLPESYVRNKFPDQKIHESWMPVDHETDVYTGQYNVVEFTHQPVVGGESSINCPRIVRDENDKFYIYTDLTVLNNPSSNTGYKSNFATDKHSQYYRPDGSFVYEQRSDDGNLKYAFDTKQDFFGKPLRDASEGYTVAVYDVEQNAFIERKIIPATGGGFPTQECRTLEPNLLTREMKQYAGSFQKEQIKYLLNILIDNIEHLKNGRSMFVFGREKKCDLLRRILNSVDTSIDPNQIISKIEDVCSKKRGYHMFSKDTHSLREFKILKARYGFNSKIPLTESLDEIQESSDNTLNSTHALWGNYI